MFTKINISKIIKAETNMTETIVFELITKSEKR